MATAAELMITGLMKSFGIDGKEIVAKGEEMHKFAEAVARGIDTLVKQNEMILANQKRADEQAALTQRIAAVRALSPYGKLPDLNLEDDDLFDPAFCKANGLQIVYSPEKSNVALGFRLQIKEAKADGRDTARIEQALAEFLAREQGKLSYGGSN